MAIVIFDLDNCVSDDSRRIPLIDWSQATPEQRYAKYHDMCHLDDPANVQLVQANASAGHAIVFMTARPVTVRAKTEAWIQTLLGVKRFTLMMRNVGDHRKSVEVKRDMLLALPEYDMSIDCVAIAYDDRQDVLDMYASYGIKTQLLKIHDVCAYTPPAAPAQEPVFNVLERRAAPPKKAPYTAVTAASILDEMAKTFRERNVVYGDNYKMVGKIMAVLFPNGAPPELLHNEQFHLVELIIVKLSRYAISGLSHQDSIRDMGVYCAMCESILNQSQTKDKK